ncbi:YfhO family protein [Shouchella patagoniensis]|uniref:YfhO family protein n=1 Tax=Shouchella patagoniensis TaxID=228576 RepID=UPI001473547D|nr:YfhO family protein [Shouchella patagoniensis]
MKLRTIFALLGASILFAIIAHAFFFYQWTNGQFMVGPNDGTAQMLPFKQFLYEEYSKASFFYSHQFGLGGGFFSQLAYYFSTSTVFFITFLIVFAGEALGFFPTADTVMFWGQAAVFVNTARLAIIIFLTTLVFRYIKTPTLYAFIGATLYGGSIMYFRHASFWEFFADAYLWLPLLVLGVEKIIREQKPWWFIAAIALSLINNFYFAYMNFIFIGIYVVLRFFIQLSDNEASIKQQLKQYVPAVVVGFLLGAIAFVPAVYGYLNNYRPSFSNPIEWFDLHDNLLFTSRLFILPAIFVFLLFCKKLYTYKPFLFFSSISLLFVIFHFSPMAGSMFNGFSAPQFRFQYMGAFALAAAIGFALPQIRRLPKRDMIFASVTTFILFTASYVVGYIGPSSLFQSGQAYLLFFSAIATLFLLFFTWRNMKRWMPVLLVFLLLSQLGLANIYQKERLFENGNLHQTSSEFLQSREYDHASQRELLDEVTTREPFSRIEWVADFRNNTPLVQDFHGVSAYSSVLNQHLLFFYYENLEIDMNRESVSRYSGFGDRANLHSLFQVSHKLAPNDEDIPIPYGFNEVSSNELYTLYENIHLLPYVRTASTIYSEDDLTNLSILDREHAMLNGIIAADNLSTEPFTSTIENRIGEIEIQPVGGTYEEGVLTVTEEEGGIDFNLGERMEDEEDDYLSFYIKNQSKTASLFPLTINEFSTSRKSLQSIYRTDVNHLTVRIEANETISLRVPQGSYQLDQFELNTESYENLHNATDNNEDIPVEVSDRKIEISYDNTTNQQMLALPVPYERGWEVTVNGQSADIEQVNYSFLGVSLEQGENEIVFSYLPPFFRLSISAFTLGLIATMGWFIARRKLDN